MTWSWQNYLRQLLPRATARQPIAGTRAWMISPQMNQAASCPTKTTAWQTTGNTAGGTRTRNHRIDSPGVTRVHEPSNSFAAKRLANSTLSREFPSAAEIAAVSPDNRLICPDLEVVIAAWPTLPETVKAEILAMARVANS